MPGLAPFAPTDHQGEGPLRVVGMGHGEEEHAAFHIAAVDRIKEGPGGQTSFAPSGFPGPLLYASSIHQIIVGFPPYDKTDIQAAKGSKATNAGHPPIEQLYDA